MVHAKGKIFITCKPSRSLENGFPAFKKEANSSCKNIKMKLTLLKKVCILYSHFEFELKKKSTILTLSEIQTMTKLNNSIITSFAGHFLIVVRFYWLE